MGRKIYVVDDSPDIIWVFSKTLTTAGYDVVGMQSGAECLQRLENDKPDLIVMDIMMPDLDGWETTKRIKENPNTRDIKVIMVSVKAEEKDIKKSIEYAHADGHVNKLDSKGLVEIVNRHLGKEAETTEVGIF
jgi:CheY-like chemotaxis protein